MPWSARRCFQRRRPGTIGRLPGDDRLTRALLWGGALAPFLVAAFVLAAAAVTPGYSHLSDTVSQLAARGAPHPELIETGLVLWGLLLQGFAWGVFRRSGKGTGARVVAALLTLSGAAVQLAAFIRDDPNVETARSTLAGAVHGLLASLAFVALLGGIFVFARTVRTNPGSRRIARFSLRVAVLGLFLGSIFELQLLQSIEGLLQRFVYALFALWLEVIIIKWLRLPRASVSGPYRSPPRVAETRAAPRGT